MFLFNMHRFTGPRVPPNSGIALLDRKRAKTAQLDPVALSHCARDLIKDGIYDPFDITLVKVWIVIRNFLDEF